MGLFGLRRDVVPTRREQICVIVPDSAANVITRLVVVVDRRAGDAARDGSVRDEACHDDCELLRAAQKVPEIQTSDEVVFYKMTLQASQCGESQLLRSILGIDLLCSHQ
jgi:hypothetical protein